MPTRGVGWRKKIRKYSNMARHLINSAARSRHCQQRYEPPRTDVIDITPFGVICSSALEGLTNTESFDMSEVVCFP